MRGIGTSPARSTYQRTSRVNRSIRSTPAAASPARAAVQRKPYRRDNYYGRNSVSLSYRFGPGNYWGVKYYQPYCHRPTGRHFAFFYSAPVSYVYVPFGFYCDSEPVYIDRTVYVSEEYPIEEYETEEVYVDPEHGPIFEEPAPPPAADPETEEILREADELVGPERDILKEAEDLVGPVRDPVFEDMAPEPEVDEAAIPPPVAPLPDQPRKAKVYREPKTVDPVPAAGSPAAEKFLRRASSAFRIGDYEEAAQLFRHAALAIPGDAAPLFAMGQALIALEQDAYAARVIRKAVALNPKILEEAGDISGVFMNQKEFDRVLEGLEERAAVEPVDSDALFLLGVQQYFSGDPRCREAFERLFSFVPTDRVSAIFLRAIHERFQEEETGLPPIPTK